MKIEVVKTHGGWEADAHVNFVKVAAVFTMESEAECWEMICAAVAEWVSPPKGPGDEHCRRERDKVLRWETQRVSVATNEEEAT